MNEFLNSIPGIDEAVSFGEIIKQVNDLKFDLVIFDTAPTGHTLRLLNFPNIMDKALVKLMQIKEKIGPMMGQFSAMMSGGEGGGADKFNQIFDKIGEMKDSIEAVNKQFQNAQQTTFVAVCIPEFLSLYETERLVVELVKFKIDIHNVVVNQVLFVEKGSTCNKCGSRSKMQGKYLAQIDDLYDDFHVIKNPLLDEEVRGVHSLNEFQKLLFDGHNLPN
jgi:arsenite-transporting ATPase